MGEKGGCMGQLETQLVEIDIKDLSKAEWNYKSDGTEEQIEKLCNSIKEDKSAGVVAVRELDGKFEVIDGNHRLTALKKLKWEKVPCENFGDISKAKAITIARRRNHKWFEDDILAYAEIFKNDVLKEFTIDQLQTYMPDTKEEMENLENLLDFDWNQFKNNGEFEDEELRTVKFVVNKDVFESWLNWKEKCEMLLGYESEAKCFEFAIIEALNIPEESLS
jgi:hypothetical protein